MTRMAVSSPDRGCSSLSVRNSARQWGHQVAKKYRIKGLSPRKSDEFTSLPSMVVMLKSGARWPTFVPTFTYGVGDAVGSGTVAVGNGGLGADVGVAAPVGVGAGLVAGGEVGKADLVGSVSATIVGPELDSGDTVGVEVVVIVGVNRVPGVTVEDASLAEGVSGTTVGGRESTRVGLSVPKGVAALVAVIRVGVLSAAPA